MTSLSKSARRKRNKISKECIVCHSTNNLLMSRIVPKCFGASDFGQSIHALNTFVLCEICKNLKDRILEQELKSENPSNRSHQSKWIENLNKPSKELIEIVEFASNFIENCKTGFYKMKSPKGIFQSFEMLRCKTCSIRYQVPEYFLSQNKNGCHGCSPDPLQKWEDLF